jgi:hypothetical protein
MTLSTENIKSGISGYLRNTCRLSDYLMPEHE